MILKLWKKIAKINKLIILSNKYNNKPPFKLIYIIDWELSISNNS